ncbi:hypothetical protein MYAM1_002875 [Malassezia yamatoensis]|uniref:Low temperature requirement A n=1 Tax=Malassezia yamatoensis TaxID=253288 RepID=A0AAJ5YSY4_9BASI|nr:hypothetical protein MYAM1_002875 [Malassezia yamatoensis]
MQNAGEHELDFVPGTGLSPADNQFGVWKDVHGVQDPNLAGTSLDPDAHDNEGGHHTLAAIFNAVHARSETHDSSHKHLAEHGFDVPVKWTHLFKRPVVRQWLFRGHLYREQDKRIPSRFELFFDLMFVGIAHVVAESAAEDYSGLNILKFILTFFPAWSVWLDMRTYVNVHGTDDIIERLHLLASMILLTGYSANASALVIFQCGEPGEVAENLSQCREIAQSIVRRDSESRKSKHAVEYYLGHGYWFAENFLPLFRSAIAFYLILRLMRIATYLYYGYALPKFRPSMWTNAAVKVLTSVFYLPILKIWDPSLVIELMFVGMTAEIVHGFLVRGALWLQNKHRIRTNKEPLYIPALSQEHAIERVVLFVLVVVGEMIINSTYFAFNRNYGPSVRFGKSAMSIMCSFMLIWLYYDADSSRTYQHALRRNAWTSLLFNAVHFPLSAALILAGTSMSSLIQAGTSMSTLNEGTEDDNGLLWYSSGSCGVALLCITFIGVLHRNLDRRGSTLLPRTIRLGARVVVGLLIILLPLMRKAWPTQEFLAVLVCLLTILVLFETVSKIGAVGRHYDEENANLVRRAKVTTFAKSNPQEIPGIKQARHELREMEAIQYPSLPKDSSHSVEDEPLKRLRLRRTLSWHPYEGLTLGETGEEDVGMEGELGHLEVKEISAAQSWAFAA